MEGHTKVMNSMKFIQKIPKHKTVTYAGFIEDIHPQKDEPRRMRLTEEGNILGYDDKKSTEMSGSETTKILVNSVISTTGARFG